MVQILDKTFEPFILAGEISQEIKSLGKEINQRFEGHRVLFIAVLNGSFMFAADLYREITLNSEISFVKLASYEGTSSSGNVKEMIGLNEDIKGRNVVVIEDIVDSGLTIDTLKDQLAKLGPKSIEVCTLLFKPDAFKGKKAPEYVGFSISNQFVVGYGLDYDGLGRNLDAIYQLKESKEEA